MNQDLAKLHGLLFHQSSGVSLEDISTFLDMPTNQVEELLQKLSRWLNGSGVSLFEHKGTFALVVDSTVSEKVAAFVPAQKLELSQPMLEVLAIVAHQQPCTKQAIDEVRGVNSEQTLRNLCSLGLLETSQNENDPLKLTQYITTRDFLMHAGLKDIKELTA